MADYVTAAPANADAQTEFEKDEIWGLARETMVKNYVIIFKTNKHVLELKFSKCLHRSLVG